MNAKTDWKVTRDSNGNYIGDYFQYTDYNRIKTNYDEVLEYGRYFYNMPDVVIPTVSGYNDYPTANLFNALEDVSQNVYNICSVKLYPSYSRSTWYPNQSTPTFDDLNRLEKLAKDYYDLFYHSKTGLKKLSFTLGGGLF